MNANLREKLTYKFERFLSKGGSSIFVSLLILFIIGFLVMATFRILLITIFPSLGSADSFWGHIWKTFLQMTAPGNMGRDSESPRWIKIATIMAGTMGIVIFSMLIGFITSTLQSTLYEFRKGRGKVLEKEHTLILGWNERVVDIIRELILANESEDRASVVVLSQEDKEKMDDFILKRLPETMTTEIITTQGDYANITELHRVNVTEAKSVIILADCSESETMDKKIESDVQTVKSIMAMIACQGGENQIPIIGEIFTQEKRDLISYFGDENIIAIDSWDIMGKLLVQTSLTSGLQIVYNEILSFDGGEIYFHEAEWNSTKFGDLLYHFKDGIPLGIYNEENGLELRPDPSTVMQSDDQLIILAEDDSTIHFENERFIEPKKMEIAEKRLEQKSKRTLFIGWHDVAKIFIREANDYLLEGSTFDILFEEPPKELLEIIGVLQEEFSDHEINLIDKNPLKKEVLSELKPFDYDNVIILSLDMFDVSADKIDSDTLIILLLLRKISAENDNATTHVITQVLNSDNQDIIIQTDVDDFIISNKLITMILAQLSEEPLIKKLYDDIFSEDGSEIYVKPADLYFTSFPQKMRFCDIIGIAEQREEICLGIRKGALHNEPDKNFGVRLNLPKDEMVEITENDFLVVLSEDEL